MGENKNMGKKCGNEFKGHLLYDSGFTRDINTENV